MRRFPSASSYNPLTFLVVLARAQHDGKDSPKRTALSLAKCLLAYVNYNLTRVDSIVSIQS